MAFSGQLYQLESSKKLNVGEYVAINGPFDSFGVIWKSEKSEKNYLNLIRGVQQKKSEKPVYQF